MKLSSFQWLKAATIVLVALGANLSMWAADGKSDATGTWKWTMSGRNGQTTETVLKLAQSGDKLTGAIIGANGNETAIQSGKVEGDAISFSVTRERNGQTTTAKYQGKLSGNTVKGTIETERNGQTRSRDWEAKREKPPVSAAGAWKWSVTTQSGDTFESKLKLQQAGEKLTGTLNGRMGEAEIQDGKLSGDEISFSVTRERDGQKFTAKYQGKLSGDTIKGKTEMTFGDQTRARDWEAKRDQAAKAAGTWKWTMTSPNTPGGLDWALLLKKRIRGNPNDGQRGRGETGWYFVPAAASGLCRAGTFKWPTCTGATATGKTSARFPRTLSRTTPPGCCPMAASSTPAGNMWTGPGSISTISGL